jgi:archaellum component FlaG (FlaF/FlaG flagellin family)
MAISAVQSIMNELTDNTISQIQNDEGTTIIFEMKENFKIISLVNQTSHLVRQRLQELAVYVEEEGNDEIINFSGSINNISKIVNTFVEERFQSLIE